MIEFTPENIEKARILAERDERERPLATVASDVPWSVDAITLEWLDACLGSGAGKPEILSFSSSGGSKGTSLRCGYQLQRAGEPEDLYLFAKTYPGFENRIANIVNGTAQAEGRFCVDIAPGLDIEAPLGHYFALDEENFRGVVITEDLCHYKDADFCDENTSISRSEAEDAVKLLANLHGTFYDHKNLTDQYPWLRLWYDVYTAGVSMRDQHNRAMVEARDVIPASLHDKGDSIFDACIDSLAISTSRPLTLIHSDVHLRNWYKTGSGQMGLGDWQCCSICNWERDFAYAVSTLLTVEDRRAWEKDLLQIYLDELSRVTDQNFDFDEAFIGYRRFLPAALLMFTPTLCPAEILPDDMQPKEASLVLIERITAAIEDLDSLAV